MSGNRNLRPSKSCDLGASPSTPVETNANRKDYIAITSYVKDCGFESHPRNTLRGSKTETSLQRLSFHSNKRFHLRSIITTLFIFLICALSGCTSGQWTTRDTSKALIPVGIIGGYFASVGVHEGGHALSAKIAGGDSIHVSVLPARDDNGGFHLGLTSFRYQNDPTPLETRFFNISGVLANASLHIAIREALKSEEVPIVAQPALQWISLMSQSGFYGEVLLGLTRVKGTDLGKEPVWVTLALLSGMLAFDICDLLIFDEPRRYFYVFVGDEYYIRKEAAKVSITCSPSYGGGALGFTLRW